MALPTFPCAVLSALKKKRWKTRATILVDSVIYVATASALHMLIGSLAD